MNVTVVQMAPVLGDRASNLARVVQYIEEAATAESRLVVFPECALSGYTFRTSAEAGAAAETIPGAASEALSRACARTGCFVVCGLLEREGTRLYNTALLAGPEGVVGRHRKAHITPVGADAFVSPGERLDVFDLGSVSVGVLICYEVRFPEAARALALKGAQVLIVAANWPAGAEVNPGIMVPARAAENNLYVLAANRAGQEREMSFIGRSGIYGPRGTVVASASDQETVLRAEIRPEQAGLGVVSVTVSGYSVDLRRHRRPDLYGEIVRVDGSQEISG